MSSAANKIVHESEVQRQHVRVKVAAKLIVNNKQFQVMDMSAGGFQMLDPEATFKIGESFSGQLILPFEGFELQTTIPCQVEHFSKDEDIVGCAFSEMTEGQISLVNLVIKSSMTGAIISEGDILHVVGRNNFVKFRKNPDDNASETIQDKVKRYSSLALLLFCGVLGLFFILGNIYENITILKSYQGVVQSDSIVARASAAGTFETLLAEDVLQVQKGQPIASIKGFAVAAGAGEGAVSGPSLQEVTTTVYSPCDCYVVYRFARDGEFRALGESLFKLIPVASRPWITVTVMPEEAQRLNLQDDVSIRVAGEASFIEGNVVDFTSVDDETLVTRVRVRPKNDLPTNLVGRPAYAEFTVY